MLKKKEKALLVYPFTTIKEAIVIEDKVGKGTEESPTKIIYHVYDRKTLEWIGTIDKFPEFINV